MVGSNSFVAPTLPSLKFWSRQSILNYFILFYFKLLNNCNSNYIAEITKTKLAPSSYTLYLTAGFSNIHKITVLMSGQGDLLSSTNFTLPWPHRMVKTSRNIEEH